MVVHAKGRRQNTGAWMLAGLNPAHTAGLTPVAV